MRQAVASTPRRGSDRGGASQISWWTTPARSVGIRRDLARGAAAFALLVAIGAASASALRAQTVFPCRQWMRLDAATKKAFVVELVRVAAANHVVIRLSPGYYVTELDKLIRVYQETNNVTALDSSLGATIHTVAAMEGDWGNGEPKLEHAKKWLGAWFEFFKQTYPDKYKRLTEDH
jgi:hypothetical protein